MTIARIGFCLAILFTAAAAQGADDDPNLTSSMCPQLAAAPPLREVPGLAVESPARTQAAAPGLRLRTHVGAYVAGRQYPLWIGPEVPAFVPLEVPGGKLDLLEKTGTVTMALYRADIAKTCSLTSDAKGKLQFPNCLTEVRLFDCTGRQIAAVPLNPYFSRPDFLEVQDIHYADGTLYFNEACITYARDAGGRCSSLVALDPIAKRVLWRTPSLVSNNWFVVAGDYLVAAYGFSGEPPAMRIIRRKDGAIVDTKSLQGTNFEMTVSGDVLSIEHWNTINRADFKMSGFNGSSPKLVRVPGNFVTPKPASTGPERPPPPSLATPRMPPHPSRP